MAYTFVQGISVHLVGFYWVFPSKFVSSQVNEGKQLVEIWEKVLVT